MAANRLTYLCPAWASTTISPGKLAQAGQRQTNFQASLPNQGKGELTFRQACPSGARANWFSGKLAQTGQRRIDFQASLPKQGKGKLVLWRVCPSRARQSEIKNGSIPKCATVFLAPVFRFNPEK